MNEELEIKFDYRFDDSAISTSKVNRKICPKH